MDIYFNLVSLKWRKSWCSLTLRLVKHTRTSKWIHKPGATFIVDVFNFYFVHLFIRWNLRYKLQQWVDVFLVFIILPLFFFWILGKSKRVRYNIVYMYIKHSLFIKCHLSYPRCYIWQKSACRVYYSYLRDDIHGIVTSVACFIFQQGSELKYNQSRDIENIRSLSLYTSVY